jgi:hypothetical protein
MTAATSLFFMADRQDGPSWAHVPSSAPATPPLSTQGPTAPASNGSLRVLFSLLLGVVACTGSTGDGDASGATDASLPKPDGAAAAVDARPPDAPLAVDASLVDAAAPDARAPDARPPDARAPDARPPDAGSPDARPPDAGVLTLRPWDGATAGLRLIDLQMFGPEVGTKLCLFGEDGDPRPYAVLAKRSRAREDEEPVPAVYAAVPGGIPLRASTSLVLSSGGGPLDTSPSGCSAAAAAPIRGGAPLAAGSRYTALKPLVNDAFSSCDTSEAEHCEFFPRYDSTRPPAPCAAAELLVIRDGKVAGGPAGYRVVNLTSTAAIVSSSELADHYTLQRHLSLAPAASDHAYSQPTGSSTLQICPRYLQACFAGVLTTYASVTASIACSQRDEAWTVASTTSSRLAATDQATTFYVAGDARPLRRDHTGLLGAPAVIVVAIDPTD